MIAAAGLSEPDEGPSVKPAELVDHNWYCASCVSAVNFRRGLFLVALCIAIPISVVCIIHFLD